jgi:hypothetical protein
MADGRLTEAIDMIGGGDGKTALDDHTVAFTCAAVANGTIDFEAFTAALQQFAGNRHWEGCDEVRSELAGVERFVFLQLATRDGVGDNRPGSHLVVLEEIVSGERFAGGLIEHVASAGGSERQKETEHERQ